MVFFTSRGTPKPSTHIYGVEWDWTSSGPTAGTRTDDAADANSLIGCRLQERPPKT